MPFLRSATRPQAVECFFCLSPALLAPETAGVSRKGKQVGQAGSRWNWHCKRCGCWNVRDSEGEMISDLPAMRDSTLNERSFALRAKPSKNRLPISSSSTSPFCRSCLANQTLIINMLANYLPEDDDPSFDSLYAALPAYLSSLHARYPPVCPNCQPGVDDILRKSDQKARGEVWTRALRRGKQRSQEGLNGSGLWIIWLWRISGAIYCSGILGSFSLSVFAWIFPDELRRLAATVSDTSLWAFGTSLVVPAMIGVMWDPYWRRRARLGDQGKVRGRMIWQYSHALILSLRILILKPMPFSNLISQLRVLTTLEVAVLVFALLKFRITQPVAIRLVRPVALTSPSTPISAQSSSQHSEPPPLSDLSLNHDPLHHTNPVFGESSLQRRPIQRIDTGEVEPMDWEPTPVMFNGHWTRPWDWDEDDDVPTPRRSDWDKFGLQKQRMFPKQTGHEETGLESLIAGWGIAGEPNEFNQSEKKLEDRRAPGGDIVITITPRGIFGGIFAILGFIRLICLGLVVRADQAGGVNAMDLPFPVWMDRLDYIEMSLHIMFLGSSFGLGFGSQSILCLGVMACRLGLLAVATMRQGWLASKYNQVGWWALSACLDFVTCIS